MSDMFKGDRERIALGVAPAVEPLRLSRCTFTMGADAVPATVDAKAVGHSLRMAVVVAEAPANAEASFTADEILAQADAATATDALRAHISKAFVTRLKLDSGEVDSTI